jgi:hypothetical protein
MDLHAGGCLCGAIRFETEGDPWWVTTCYCRFCQKATGAPVFIEPILTRDRVRVTRGTPARHDHRSEGSGAILTIHFCATCSVKTHYSFERFPDHVGICAGAFDDPGWFDVRPDNSMHVFLDQALDGTLIPPGFDTYRAHYETTAGEPCTSTVYRAITTVGTRRQAWGTRPTILPGGNEVERHEGGCLCGALRYEIRGAPERVTTCYCMFCQKVTGSPVFIEPIFRREQLVFLKGISEIYRHRSAGSGAMIDMHFCPVCSVRTHLAFERFPDNVGLYAGTFDDPSWFDIRPEDSKHIFLDTALDGTIIPPGFVTYREHISTREGIPCPGTVHEAFKVVGTRRQG